MRRLIAAAMTVALCCLALATADLWACPPSTDNLPGGTAVLPTTNPTMMPGSMLPVRPYEKPRTGPFTLGTPPSAGHQSKVTPIPIPGPRSTTVRKYGTSQLMPKPNTLAYPPRLRLQPRPTATPIPIP
jgi:hypothetical protein